MFIFGKNYEECKSCQTLKEQLEFERSEKLRLTETLLEILKPKVVEAPPVTINEVAQSSAIFARRRAALEAADREEAKILAQRKHIARPDIAIATNQNSSIEKLEQEVGITQEVNEEKGA
jgi:hypothetical protein